MTTACLAGQVSPLSPLHAHTPLLPFLSPCTTGSPVAPRTRLQPSSRDFSIGSSSKASTSSLVHPAMSSASSLCSKTYGIPLCTSFSSSHTPSSNKEKLADSYPSPLCPNVCGSTNRLGVAFGCVGVGAIGMCLIWWYQASKGKYVWLHQSLFIPGISTGFAGLTSTLVNMFSNDNGSLGSSTTATLTAVIACIVIC